MDRDCAALDTRDGLVGACTGWECRGGFCRLRPRDGDRDLHHRAVDTRGVACVGGDDCDDNSAARAPGLTEICDGRDQDCDLAIDESAAMAATRRAPIVVLPLSPSVETFDLVSGPEGSVAFVHAAGGTSIGLELVEGETPFEASPGLELHVDVGTAERRGCGATELEPIAPDATCVTSTDCGAGEVCAARDDGVRVCGSGGATCSTDEECGDGEDCNGRERCAPGSPGATVRGCVAGTRPCTGDDTTCDEVAHACRRSVDADCGVLADVAVASLGDTWIGAAIGRGCPEGTLHPVHFDDATRTFRAVGLGDRSASWDGIDPTTTGCVGASRAGGPGARAPSLAALPDDRSSTPRALLAYLADAASGSEAASVETVGLWLEHDHTGGRWTHATGSGTPTVLADPATADTTRPATLAVPTTPAGAFVVAYGRDGGGVAVHLFEPPPEPAPTCPAPRDPATTCIALSVEGGPATILASPTPERGRLERTSPVLAPPTSVVLGTAEVRGDVALARGPLRSSGAIDEIALVYVEADEVVLAFFTVSAAARTLVPDTSRAFRIPAPGVHDVSIEHLASGLATRVVGESPGGYVLLWSTPEGTFAARYRDRDGVLDVPSHVSDLDLSDPRLLSTTVDGATDLSIVGRDEVDRSALVVVPDVCHVETTSP